MKVMNTHKNLNRCSLIKLEVVFDNILLIYLKTITSISKNQRTLLVGILEKFLIKKHSLKKRVKRLISSRISLSHEAGCYFLKQK